MITFEHILTGAAILVLLSIIASRASGRLGIPAVLLFLVIGMLAGSEGPGGIYFDDARAAQSLGVVALSFILFSGGLDTSKDSIRPVLFMGLGLSTAGVVITAVLTGLFAALMLHLPLLEGLLLGAVVSATDAAAVFTVLRAKSVGLTGNLTPLIELESGSNDPMAVFLTVGITSLLTSEVLSPWALVPMLVIQMALGAALGYGMGKLGTFALNHLGLEYDGLYPVFTVALVLLIYGTATLVGGNGFLAIYLAGVVVGNSDFVNKRSILRFHDGVAWLMQIAMFLTLGLLVFPSRLLPVAGAGLILAVFLTVIARPVAVFAVLGPSRMSLAEKAMVSWVGLRGAAPIVLATFPLLAGVPQSALFFDLVFFIVLTSVLLQGTTVPLAARWLRLDAPSVPKPPSPC